MEQQHSKLDKTDMNEDISDYNKSTFALSLHTLWKALQPDITEEQTVKQTAPTKGRTAITLGHVSKENGKVRRGDFPRSIYREDRLQYRTVSP